MLLVGRAAVDVEQNAWLSGDGSDLVDPEVGFAREEEAKAKLARVACDACVGTLEVVVVEGFVAVVYFNAGMRGGREVVSGEMEGVDGERAEGVGDAREGCRR